MHSYCGLEFMPHAHALLQLTVCGFKDGHGARDPCHASDECWEGLEWLVGVLVVHLSLVPLTIAPLRGRRSNVLLFLCHSDIYVWRACCQTAD